MIEIYYDNIAYELNADTSIDCSTLFMEGAILLFDNRRVVFAKDCFMHQANEDPADDSSIVLQGAEPILGKLDYLLNEGIIENLG